MATTVINKKKYCVTCDKQLSVTSIPTQTLDKWTCLEHGEREEAVIYLTK